VIVLSQIYVGVIHEKKLKADIKRKAETDTDEEKLVKSGEKT
jgi:hypothetical protein